MESLDEAVGDGMVGSGSDAVGAEKGHQGGPERRLKLGTTVRCDRCRDTKAAYPCRDEGAGNCLSVDVGNRNGFRPTGEAVNDGQEVGMILRER